MEVVLHILPIFALVGVGTAAVRFGALDAASAAGLSRYVYWIAFPALLLHALAATERPGLEEARALLAYALALAGPAVLAAALAAMRRWPARREIVEVGFGEASCIEDVYASHADN